MKALAPTQLRDVLGRTGIVLSKRFGQNFLVDRNALASMASLFPSGKDIVFVEIAREPLR